MYKRQVYLDGILLKRGYDADYVIDYNTAEITFMPKIFIRTSMHIVIEFLYTDYNYAQASYGLYTEKLELQYLETKYQIRVGPVSYTHLDVYKRQI